MTDQTRQAVDDYLKAEGKKLGEFLSTGRRGFGQCMSTRQYARPLSEWIASIGWTQALSLKSGLRRVRTIYSSHPGAYPKAMMSDSWSAIILLCSALGRCLR